MRRLAPAAFALLGVLAAAPVPAQDLGLQLDEIRALVREKRYPLALESLRLIARQVQDLRVGAIAPAFPPAPPGWTAGAPLSLLGDADVWSGRLEAVRSYTPEAGGARIDLILDLHSPLAPATALGLSALIPAADPTARLREIAGQPARVRFVPDTGEGEVRMLVAPDTVVTARGGGLTAADPLVRLVEGIDFAALRAAAGL
ncbi:MAG TPA: hypothetical protein VI078_11130 [bacterium]